MCYLIQRTNYLPPINDEIDPSLINNDYNIIDTPLNLFVNPNTIRIINSLNDPNEEFSYIIGVCISLIGIYYFINEIITSTLS
tara:strand:- start:204 stop:452 length:249 start_codon:yes stop_codon:yes gene_type:complete